MGGYPRTYRQTAKQWMSPTHSSSDSSIYLPVVTPSLIQVPIRAQSAHLPESVSMEPFRSWTRGRQ